MSGKRQIPSPATVTLDQVKTCLSVYVDVVKKHYETKVKDPKKAAAAVKRDTWRYDELPGAVGGKGFRLPQLEELVQWKITHGHSRPFLPGMIRKNSAQAVQAQTLRAADLLHVRMSSRPKSDSLEATLEAMKTLEALNGVGPATSSLIASVYEPTEVPYFEDELFQWLCLDLSVAEGKVKLKYDKKEYAQLFKAVAKLRDRLGPDSVTCVDLEKAAFALIHGDYVDPESKDVMKALGINTLDVLAQQGGKHGEADNEPTKERVPELKTKKGLSKGNKRNLNREQEVEGSAKCDITTRPTKRTKR